MRITGFALVAALALGAGTLRAGQEDAGFVPLFNGKDLTGWVNVNCAPETWSVRDGMIHCTGKPICELRTDRMYENFVLELEYKHLDPGGNAGVFIWGDALTARGQPFVRSVEIQVLDGRNSETYTSHGDIFSIHGAKLTPDRPHPAGAMRSLPSERRARPAGEWNHYRIVAQNGSVRLAVNGQEVSGGYNVSPRKGYIHLESEGGVVQWRNIRLKELPPSGPLPPREVAHHDEGFSTLYTGTDFRGWRFRKGHEGHWVSKDWVIAYDGKSEAEDKDLWTEAAFGDSEVIVDWRWTGERPETPYLPLRISGAELPEPARRMIARELASRSNPGGWYRARLTRRAGTVSLSIDDWPLFQGLPWPEAAGQARIGLRHDAPPIEFANVFIRTF